MDRNQRRRRTKSGEAAPPPSTPPDHKKGYNLRKRPSDNDVRWVNDDTLMIEEDSDDSDYVPPTRQDKKPTIVVEEEEKKVPEKVEEKTRNVHGIQLPKDIPVSVKIHIHAKTEEMSDDEDYDDDEDDNEDDDEDYDDEDDDIDEEEIAQLLARSLGASYGRNPGQAFFIIGDEPPSNKGKNAGKNEPALALTHKERKYFEELPKAKSKKLLGVMKSVKDHMGESEVPFKFRVLEMDIPEEIKALLIRKIDTMNRMGPESGESQKMRVWVESMLRIPFGKVVPLPVTLAENGAPKCAEFLDQARLKLDKATYGMEPAKMQIMQILAQWMANPESVGNCIAMQGPAGVGKTSFARNGIANVLNRPFQFFSLGGASDIAHYIGHSYTYEGSMWGRIVDAIMQSKCMNPVLYFDELDKISGTPHGEEIASMLIHLTDRTQNSQYHDRYFAGVDFDLSKVLFVFSYNDENKINPILKDRMTIIQCQGYKDPEKKVIVANYVWPEILNRMGIEPSELSATEAAAEYIIKEYSQGEQGMRSLIRVVESVVARINLLRMTKEEDMKKYKFAVPVKFPMKLDVETVKQLLCDWSPKEPETWRSLYN